MANYYIKVISKPIMAAQKHTNKEKLLAELFCIFECL